MASPATDAAVPASGVAGLIAIFADTHALFDKVPMLGFVCMGMLGGFAGWALMIEIGRLDGKTPGAVAGALLRRLGLGVSIGVAAGICWGWVEDQSRGLWMLGAGVAATSPVELSRLSVDLVGDAIRAAIARGDKGEKRS